MGTTYSTSSNYSTSNPAFPPERYRVKHDAWQAYERGYHAAIRKEAKRIPANMNLASALAREAWVKGYESASFVAAEPDPFPAITREQQRLTKHLMQPRAGGARFRKSSPSNADFNAAWRAGFEAAKAGKKRLADLDSLTAGAWYDGYDAGVRLMANLQRAHDRVATGA